MLSSFKKICSKTQKATLTSIYSVLSLQYSKSLILYELIHSNTIGFFIAFFSEIEKISENH